MTAVEVKRYTPRMAPWLAFLLGALFGAFSVLLWHWYILANVLADAAEELGRPLYPDDS